MKIGVAQLNPTIGDIPGNQQKIKASYEQLCNEDCSLVVVPEMALLGYSPRDLLFDHALVVRQFEALQALAHATGTVPLVIGFVQDNPKPYGKRLTNSVAWCEGGKVHAVGHKCLLPNYDVFDEARYFEPGEHPLVVNWQGKKIGLSICEDLWTRPSVGLNTEHKPYAHDPIAYWVEQKVDFVINIAASPWYMNKESARENVLATAARRCHCPLLYVNQVGANDELIFDGQSLLMSSQGKVVYRLPAFREAVVAVPVSQALVNEASVYLPVVPEQERLFAALVLGVRDYVQKTGFQRVLIGLSGGIDSALTAVIATKALGPQHVTGVYLPSVYSSPRSGQDAAELAHNLGIRLHTMAIDPVVDAARAGLEGLLGTEGQVTGPLVRENLQSRSRCLLLMALANQWGALVLNTGNKSELMTGYCTQYGDLCGALGVLADLLKTEVYALAHWVNDQKPVIPAYTLSREPSAELSPNQKDQDFLPPYPVLDKMVHLCLEAHCTPENMVRYGLAPEWVQRFFELYTRSEYKRSQMPLGLKVSPLALGCGRRVPVACKWG